MKFRWHRHHCTDSECDKTCTHADAACTLPEAHPCNYHSGYTAHMDKNYHHQYAYRSNKTKGHEKRRINSIRKALILKNTKIK